MQRRRFFEAIATLTVVLALGAACTIDRGSDHDGHGGAPATPSAKVQFNPAAGAKDVNPAAPVSVTATDGVLRDVRLVNDSGKQVAGTLSPDGKTYTTTEPLGYGGAYTWAGTATGPDHKPVPIKGGFATVAPKSQTAVNVQIADGAAVGIAAPIILQFNAHVADKAAVERALAVTTTPPTPGSWAWLPDDHGSRVHWRPQNYWAPGTKVHVDAKLYGVNYGGGAYGLADLTSDFTIGRSQIVKAVASSHRMRVIRDGQEVMDFAVSYGQGNEARNTTRSGIHVATEKYQDFTMSNPPYYTNAREHWAVRISNNGEFIHANPLSVGSQGSANVTNGCINLNPTDAQTYFPTALYGDPVEVTGTPINLSAADGDIYDWTIDWPKWQSMSALHDGPQATVSATPIPAAPIRGN